MNMTNFIKPWVEKTPDKTAVIYEDKRITYAQLDRLINKVANALTGLGLKKGEVVSVYLMSSPELYLSYLGAVRAGFVINVLNIMLKEIELEYILKDCKASVLIYDSRRKDVVDRVKGNIESLKHEIIVGEKSGDIPTFQELIEKASDEFTPVEVDENEDLCHLMYTSGTTGWPKGVMATHKNIYHNLTEFGKIHYNENDIIYVATPIFHCWGLINGTYAMWSRGGTVITIERFYPDKALDDIEKYRPTVFIGVPPMYNLMVKTPDVEKRKLDSVVFCLSAATKMPPELIKMVEQTLKWKYAEAWGLTEVSCVGTTAPYWETRIGSCGRAMGGAQLKTVDEEGNELPPGKEGELCIKGPCVTKGYLNKPEATKEVFKEDGWFHSGDIAYLDEDGFAYIVDRKKDMINVGGEKVFPSEVEDIVLTNPKIKDVVIVGVPDELKGEKVKAFIQLKEGEKATEDEIIQFCKEKMAPYKVPSEVEFLEELPRSAAGKALRRLLRDRELEKMKK